MHCRISGQRISILLVLLMVALSVEANVDLFSSTRNVLVTLDSCRPVEPEMEIKFVSTKNLHLSGIRTVLRALSASPNSSSSKLIQQSGSIFVQLVIHQGNAGILYHNSAHAIGDHYDCLGYFEERNTLTICIPL